MARTRFENLRVYLLAEEIADLSWEIVVKWSQLAQNTVGRQLINSADSIGANIAEGSGRGSFADNRRFVKIARGSLFEVKHWLRRAVGVHGAHSPTSLRCLRVWSFQLLSSGGIPAPSAFSRENHAGAAVSPTSKSLK